MRVIVDEKSERPSGSTRDPNARCHHHRFVGNALAATDRERGIRQRHSIVSPRDSQGLAKLAGAAAEIAITRRVPAPLAHQRDSFERLESANKNCAPVSGFPRYRVEAPVNSVNEIHV